MILNENTRFWTKIRDSAARFLFENRRFWTKVRDFAAVTGYASRTARGAQWRVLSGSKTRHLIHVEHTNAFVFWHRSSTVIVFEVSNFKGKKSPQRQTIFVVTFLPKRMNSMTKSTKRCQSNLALCHLKQGQNEDCVTTCNEILSRDGKAVKALFRRPLLQPHIAKHLEGVTGLKPE